MACLDLTHIPPSLEPAGQEVCGLPPSHLKAAE